MTARSMLEGSGLRPITSRRTGKTHYPIFGAAADPQTFVMLHASCIICYTHWDDDERCKVLCPLRHEAGDCELCRDKRQHAHRHGYIGAYAPGNKAIGLLHLTDFALDSSPRFIAANNAQALSGTAWTLVRDGSRMRGKVRLRCNADYTHPRGWQCVPFDLLQQVSYLFDKE